AGPRARPTARDPLDGRGEAPAPRRAPPTRLAFPLPRRAVRPPLRRGAGSAHGDPRPARPPRCRRRRDQPAHPPRSDGTGGPTRWEHRDHPYPRGGRQMRILPAAVTAIAAFELRRRLRSRASLVGAIGFLLVLAAGHYLYWTAPPPRPEDSRLFGDAFALFIIAAAHLGISDDRMHGVDTFL